MFRRKSKNQKFVNAEDLFVGAIITLGGSDYTIIQFDSPTESEPVAIVYASPMNDDGSFEPSYDTLVERALVLIVHSKTPFIVLK